MKLDSTIAETLFSLPSTITTYFHSRSSNKSKVELLFHLVEGPSQLQCSSIAYLDVKSFLSSELSRLDFSFKLYWCSIVCKIIFNFLWNLKIKTVCLKTFSSNMYPILKLRILNEFKLTFHSNFIDVPYISNYALFSVEFKNKEFLSKSNKK